VGSGRREGEAANWGDGVARNFEMSAGFASSVPSAAVFLKGWSHEALGDELSRCPSPGVAEGLEGIENLEAKGRRDLWARFARSGIAIQLD